jgi:hypothetical protein
MTSSRPMFFRIGLVACLLGLKAILVQANETPPGAPVPPGATPAPGKPGRPEKPDFPKVEDVLKDFEQVKPGNLDEKAFITLWYNKKTDELFAQIPASLIGKQFLIASSIAGGGFATGFQLDHWLAYFERLDKELVLMRVDPRYAADDKQPIADVVKRSYSDEVVRSVSIKTMKGQDPIIDLGDLFKADLEGVVGFTGGGGANPKLSKWISYKTFKENTELTVDMAVGRGPRGAGFFGVGSSGGRRMRMHYSLSSIPKTDYKPRLADPRIGYFMTVRYDWGKDYESKSLFNRYITRWNLQKRDPSLAISPPKQPIVWYVEKTVPIRWRRHVIDGILEWNKSFEKCGIVNAMQVLQQEDDEAQYGRLDPEDVRYNFFRWIVAGIGFAMGPSRDHPLTGEIFDADIVFDDTMVRIYVDRYYWLSGGPPSWLPYNPYLADFFNAHPEWRYRTAWESLMPNVRMQSDENDEFRENLLRFMAQRGRPICDRASSMAHQLAVARIALEAKGLTPEENEEFLGQFVKEVVMHEVGHCLGLRHNFKASAWKSMSEVAMTTEHDVPTVGSVMDYNPPIVAPRGQKQGLYVTQTIGPYDYWAIEYGYRAPGKGENEPDMLKKITARVAEEGLDYGTDEDTFGVLSADPLSNRFDAGKDTMQYAEHQIALVESLLKDIDQWGIKDGESFSRLRRAFRWLVNERARVGYYVARFVGGQHIYRDHKGDPDARPPIMPVDAEQQRKAKDFVIRNVLSEEAYKFDPELLNKLAPGRYWHWNSDDFDFEQEFNIHDQVASGQFSVLFTMMNPFTITRIHDSETKFPKDTEPYSLAEHIQGLSDAVWSELNKDGGRYTAGKPYVNSFRRNLQRLHLNMLSNLVLSSGSSWVPADAGALARLAAADLSSKMDRALKNPGLDPSSRAHLTDSKQRIDKALEADYVIGAGSSSRLMIPDSQAGQETREPIPVLPSR